MSTPTVAYESPSIAPVVKPPRLQSLDVFRGITIAGMLLVNNPGDWGHIYAPLEHADWHGLTPTDLIFPFFLFIVGVAIPFSQAARSAGQGLTRGQLAMSVLSRSLSLFLLGVLGYSIPVNWPPALAAGAPGSSIVSMVRAAAVTYLALGFVALLFPWKSRKLSNLMPFIVGLGFVVVYWVVTWACKHCGVFDRGALGRLGILDPHHLRVPGVLQRIALCYLVVAVFALFTRWHLQLLFAVALCAIYCVLMLGMPLGGHTIGSLTAGDNFAYRVDSKLLGTHAYTSNGDPEGLVSTLPAIATALFGVLAGHWLRSDRPPTARAAGLLAGGVFAAVLGYCLQGLIPINKALWTPSYAVACAGLACLGLGFCFYLIDVLGYRKWSVPFAAYGVNAITAFVLSGIVGRLSLLIRVTGEAGKPSIALKSWVYNQFTARATHWFGGESFFARPINVSLYYALCYVLVFMALMLVLRAMRITLKV